MSATRQLFVPNDRAVFMSETGKHYTCPHCHRSIFANYEGHDDPSEVECHGLLKGHTLIWAAASEQENP